MTTWRGTPFRALLAEKEEDRFTEFLAHLLQDEAVLQSFLSRLCSLPLKDLGTVEVRTQVLLADGRPDLVIHGPRAFLVFEAKVGSWFHEGQLDDYTEAIAKWTSANPSGIARLYTLIPALRAEDAATSQTPVRANGHARAIQWEEVASLFSEIAAGTADPRLRLFLLEFSGLVVDRFGEVQRPFTAEEAALVHDRLAGGTMVRCLEIVQHTRQVLAQDSHNKLTHQAAMGWQGFGLKRGDRAWWFGYWPAAWAGGSGSALVLHLRAFLQQTRPPIPEDLPQPIWISTNVGHVVPLPVSAGVELGTLAETHASTIAAYALRVPSSGIEE